MVTLNIQKKHILFLSATLLSIGIGFVIAYGSGNSTLHGHDSGELQGAISYVYQCRNSNDASNAPACPSSVTIGTQGPCDTGFTVTKYLGEWGICGTNWYDTYIPPSTTSWNCIEGYYGGPIGKAWVCSNT